MLKDGQRNTGPVIYWMSRDQRVHHNWALLFAQELSYTWKKSLMVIFTITSDYPGAEIRHYTILIDGLKEIEKELFRFNIPFRILSGDPAIEVPVFCREINPAALVTDFDPLRQKRKWKQQVSEQISLPVYEVDAHNIIPCLTVSNKKEYGAYTLRPKIKKLMPEYLDKFPEVKKNIEPIPQVIPNNWQKIMQRLTLNHHALAVKEFDSGPGAALRKMKIFIYEGLDYYDVKKNDPNQNGTSMLSPYLHYGHLSAQYLLMEIIKREHLNSGAAGFIEELVVRRELSDNFCYYNPHYDSFEGFPQWAKDTLNNHRKDEREYLYSMEQFENSQTHDQLWNAVQHILTVKGTMHGYLRMYWAKKILEWTSSPEEALHIAITLNDRYQLDGRDPNGYTGCCWSIGGVHDRPWTERPVFGKIRYMNYAGCKRKFNVDQFIKNSGYR